MEIRDLKEADEDFLFLRLFFSLTDSGIRCLCCLYNAVTHWVAFAEKDCVGVPCGHGVILTRVLPQDPL